MSLGTSMIQCLTADNSQPCTQGPFYLLITRAQRLYTGLACLDRPDDTNSCRIQNQQICSNVDLHCRLPNARPGAPTPTQLPTSSQPGYYATHAAISIYCNPISSFYPDQPAAYTRLNTPRDTHPPTKPQTNPGDFYAHFKVAYHHANRLPFPEAPPRRVYSLFSLGLPNLYFLRAKKIFREANANPIKNIALETPAQTQGKAQMPDPSHAPPHTILNSAWASFVDSLMREWQALNMISGLLLL